MPSLGTLFAFGALFGWAFGDFALQRLTREIGVWRARFFIDLSLAVGILPFILPEIGRLPGRPDDLVLLVVATVIMFLGGYFNLRALKRGKLAIVEPITGLELPLTAGLSMVLLGEWPSALQFALIWVIFMGITSAVSKGGLRKIFSGGRIERGVMLAGFGAVGLALTNFTVGISSRGTSPLMTVWFTATLIGAASAIVIFSRDSHPNILNALKRVPGLILLTCALDGFAWVSFAYAATHLPISIATSISESYIALAAFLGVFLNHEKLRRHQIAGVALAIGGVIVLAAVTPG